MHRPRLHCQAQDGPLVLCHQRCPRETSPLQTHPLGLHRRVTHPPVICWPLLEILRRLVDCQQKHRPTLRWQAGDLLLVLCHHFLPWGTRWWLTFPLAFHRLVTGPRVLCWRRLVHLWRLVRYQRKHLPTLRWQVGDLLLVLRCQLYPLEDCPRQIFPLVLHGRVTDRPVSRWCRCWQVVHCQQKHLRVLLSQEEHSLLVLYHRFQP